MLWKKIGSSIDDSTDKVASVYLAKIVNDKLEAFPVQLKRVSTNILDLPELIKRQLVLKTEYDAYFLSNTYCLGWCRY